MKKPMLLIGAMCLALGLTACYGNTEKETPAEFSAQSVEVEEPVSTETGD